jgi:hypothetical protein
MTGRSGLDQGRITQHPIDEPDLWGDLGSFREAAT